MEPPAPSEFRRNFSDRRGDAGSGAVFSASGAGRGKFTVSGGGWGTPIFANCGGGAVGRLLGASVPPEVDAEFPASDVLDLHPCDVEVGEAEAECSAPEDFAVVVVEEVGEDELDAAHAGPPFDSLVSGGVSSAILSSAAWARLEASVWPIGPSRPASLMSASAR